MRENITKIKSLIASHEKELPYLFLLIFATFLTIPFFFLSFFATPAADDFSQASRILSKLPESFGFIEYLRVVLSHSVDIYKETQGAYFTNLLISLNPIVFSVKLIPAVYVLNLIILIFSSLYIAESLSSLFFDRDKRVGNIIGLLLLIFTLQFIPVAESLFWYAGIIAYTLPYSLTLLFIGNLINIFLGGPGKSRVLKGVILAVLLGGVSFPIGIFLSLGAITSTLLLWIKKHPSWKSFLLITTFLITGFLYNVLGPGNTKRMNLGFNLVTPKKAIIMSFWESAIVFRNILLNTPLVLALILITPYLLSKIKSYGRKKTLNPLMVGLLLIPICASILTPIIYVGGGIYNGAPFPPRYGNIVTMFYFWVVFSYFLYFLHWLKGGYIKDVNFSQLVVPLLMIGLLATQVTLSNLEFKKISAITFFEDMRYGTVIGYRKEIGDLYRRLESSKDKNVVFTIKNQPKSLKKVNVKSDHNYWENRGLAQFFGAKSVRSERRK